MLQHEKQHFLCHVTPGRQPPAGNNYANDLPFVPSHSTHHFLFLPVGTIKQNLSTQLRGHSAPKLSGTVCNCSFHFQLQSMASIIPNDKNARFGHVHTQALIHAYIGIPSSQQSISCIPKLLCALCRWRSVALRFKILWLSTFLL